MLALDEVKKRLQDRNLTAVAKSVNLSYDTVRRVAKGDYIRISYSAVKALSDYLLANSHSTSPSNTDEAAQ